MAEFYTSREDQAPRHTMPKPTDILMVLAAIGAALLISQCGQDNRGDRPTTTTTTQEERTQQ